MQLLSELIAGVRGAENGQALVYVRGTSTLANVYSDYDGSQVLAQPLTLDSNGGVECYVNEEVDVRIADASGVVVRAASPMQTANSVEYIGPSFRGRRYSDALAGVNQPTSVQEILDKWETSAGAPDFNVMIGGVETSLEVAMASSAAVFINVKDPTYGAVGDGIADDTVAIQAALTAATTPKSIVLFPAGTYKVTAKLTVPVGVNIWGMGPSASAILLSDLVVDLLEYGAGMSAWFQEIRNIALLSTGSPAGKYISITGASARKLRMVNILITDAGHAGDRLVDVGANCQLQIHSCALALVSPINDSGAVVAASTARVEVFGSTFVVSGALGGVLNSCIAGTLVKAVGCLFDLSLVTSGPAAGIALASPAKASIVGNEFLPGAALTSVGITAVSTDAATAVYEAGNIFKSGFVSNIAGFTAHANHPQYQNLNRESRINNLTDDSASVALDGHFYGTVVVTRTAAGGAQAFTSTLGPEGCSLVVIVVNNGFGVIAANPSVNSGGFYAGNPAITKPTANKLSIARFRCVVTGGGAAWVAEGTYLTDF